MLQPGERLLPCRAATGSDERLLRPNKGRGAASGWAAAFGWTAVGCIFGWGLGACCREAAGCRKPVAFLSPRANKRVIAWRGTARGKEGQRQARARNPQVPQAASRDGERGSRVNERASRGRPVVAPSRHAFIVRIQTQESKKEAPAI